MVKISSDDLGAIKLAQLEKQGGFIRVGMSTCGIAAGAGRVYRVLEEEIKKRGGLHGCEGRFLETETLLSELEAQKYRTLEERFLPKGTDE